MGHFGDERMLYDYGPKAKLTSDLVRDWMYDRKDPLGLAKAARDGGYRFLSGHFPLSRYLEPFAGAIFLTWLRDPAQRVWSAYRHYRRHHGFEGSLQDFYRTANHRNQQSRMTAPGLDRFDFVGVLERNRASLEALAEVTGLRLRERRANLAPEDDRPAPPTEAQWAEIAALNADDVALYHRALERFA